MYLNAWLGHINEHNISISESNVTINNHGE